MSSSPDQNQPTDEAQKVYQLSGSDSVSEGGNGSGYGSGHNMDRVIEKPTLFGIKRSLVIMGVALLVVLVPAFIWFSDVVSTRTFTVANDRITVSTVTEGTFEDYIPVRGRVAPLKTLFLDAVQGGRVEEMFVEDGASVIAGQQILRLSNSDLQLSVMSTESRVMEQLNAIRDQELRLEQNRLGHKHTLVELDYNIRRLSRDVERNKNLIEKGHVSSHEYDNMVDQLDYYRERRVVTKESQESDERMMVAQLAFFNEKTKVMEDNLAFARKSLEALQVKAPVAGRLSGFDLEVGQNVPRGARIGQIDNPKEFKLTANIDEYYLGRVDLEQMANFTRGGKDYQLRITKIYPNVVNGQFQVDMQFLEDKPADLRRGQTIQSKLTLGDANPALLIPNGPFMQDTGGQWIFVLSSDNSIATRRQIKLGQKNNRYVEVLEGLQSGEKVVTSSYSSFMEVDQLNL